MKALTHHDAAPKPKQRRRRSDETRRGFTVASGMLRRVVRAIFHPWEAPTTLDDAQLQQLYWNDQASMHQFYEMESSHDDATNHLSPHL